MTAGELRELLARVIRAREAYEDGELELVSQLLADLELELAALVRRLEEAAG